MNGPGDVIMKITSSTTFMKMRPAAIVLLFAMLLIPVLGQDRDLSTEGTPAPVQPEKPVAPKQEAQAAKVSSKADLLAPMLMPARTFQNGNGFTRIAKRGRGLEFHFTAAKMNEVVREIAKVFDCVVVYAGDPERTLTDNYVNITSAAQLLSLITDMTDLVVVYTQRGFIIQQLDSPTIAEVKFSDVVEMSVP